MYLLVSAVSIVIAATMIACSKSDAQIAIEATKEVEATAFAHITATASADEAQAQKMIVQLCDVIEKRFKTDRTLSSIETQRLMSAIEWVDYNADKGSEIALIAGAFADDLKRVMDGEFVSWADAFQQSGSKYVGDCKSASWKH